MNEDYIEVIEIKFPYPIATIFARLLTDECLDPGEKRLRYTLDTADAICRFLAVLVLCECRERLEVRGGVPSPALIAEFGRQFRRPSWGSWLSMTREGLKWLHHEGEPGLLVGPLVEFFFARLPKESAATQVLGRLLTLRNDWSHGRLKPMYPHEFKALCEEADPHLETALEALRFLPDYNLTFVSKIEVDKPRRHDPSFEHHLDKIRGKSETFRGARSTLRTTLDSDAVILMHPGSGRYLNLDPLLVYEGTAGRATDIFFYNGMKSAAVIEYVGCKQGGVFESSNSQHAARLIEEIQNLLRLFQAAEEEQAHVG